MMRFFTLATATLIGTAVAVTTTGTWNKPFASDLVAQETPAPTKKKKASEPSHRSLEEARIRKQLNKAVDLIYDAEPVGDVRAQLSKDLAINIIVDQSLDGILDDDTEVSANLAGIRLADGLRAMLRPVDATFAIRDGVLLIIPIGDAEEPENLALQMIEVRELLKSIRLAEPTSAPDQLLIDTITSAISPDSWVCNGSGNGVAKCIGGVLVIRASESVSEGVQNFVKDLEYQIKSREE